MKIGTVGEILEATPDQGVKPADVVASSKLGTGLHFNVPMDTYHSDCCEGVSVSGSVLFTLYESCPARALATHYLSPWPREDDASVAMAFGEAAHCYIVEGKKAFGERYAIKPDDMTFVTREGKAWRAEQEAAGRLIIAFRDFEKITQMAIGLAANPAAMNAFDGGAPEVTAICKDDETGLWLKARPDYLRKQLAINYKTALSAAPVPWKRQAWNLGYHVSAALCVDILKALGEPAHYAFVVQEKEAPYLTAVRVLADEFLEAGRLIYRHTLRAFADCVATGKWPGYSEEVETVSLPLWADHSLATMGII